MRRGDGGVNAVGKEREVLCGGLAVAVTVAVLLMLPIVVGVTLIVIVALPATARLPSAQVTVCELIEHVPWLGIAEPKVNPAGRTSVTLTPVAIDGP